MSKVVVVCADVGSVLLKKPDSQSKFGWWSSENEARGHWPSELVEHVNLLLSRGRKVALGFECPLFVPLPECDRDLGRARHEEGNRPWSAAAGSHVLATGLVQVAWVLREIRKTHHCMAYLKWREFDAAEEGLLVWEAFVSGPAKAPRDDPESHIKDAEIGARAFIKRMDAKHLSTAEQENEESFYSLIGAVMLLTGCAIDTLVLQQPCVVVKADLPDAI